ncbi:MAG: ATP-grasp domain-containing protein [Patescibacteria group bacterium]|mgnify:FL=1
MRKEKKRPDFEVLCALGEQEKIKACLREYEEGLLAITCRGEVHIPDFIKIIPYVPYLRTPTTESLKWATDKAMMRRAMRAYDKAIVPKFLVVGRNTKEGRKEIKGKIGFPLVLKPANLASSLLVSICFHEEELEASLRKLFRNIRKIYKNNNRPQEPKILVEEFMEGSMYSVDAYVSSRGTIWFCPLVHVETGRSVGFDDFFAYKTITPTTLNEKSVCLAEHVAKKAIRAMGLRSVTTHIELMRTESGWKVIELGPRVGGFRVKLYKLAFGFDHGLNDILVRIPKKPIVTQKAKGHAAMLRFFAKKEGTLVSLQGVQKMRNLKSYVEDKVNKKIGERCTFAKNGGRGVVEVTLFNKSRSLLQADIRRLEQMIKIEIR